MFRRTSPYGGDVGAEQRGGPAPILSGQRGRPAVIDAVFSDALPGTARPLVLKQVIAGVDQPDLQPMAQVVSDRDQSSPGPHQILIIGDRLSAAATGLKHPRNLHVRHMHCPQRVSSFSHQTTL